MMMVPSLGPVIASVNVQLARGCKLFLHVFVSVKSMPEAPMSRMRIVEWLVLVRMPVLG
jgi:hypothetical protein